MTRSTLKEITGWLLQAENSIAEFYGETAQFFAGDKEFANFLSLLSGDEKCHGYIIAKALARLKDDPDVPALLSLGRETEDPIIETLKKCRKKMSAGTLTKEELLDSIIALEYSEWNDIFLYVISSLKDSSKEFIPAAANIQQHKKAIERFVGTLSSPERFLRKLKNIPDVMQERLLVVDDSAPAARLLSAILSKEGLVETAENGKEALEKMARGYFAAIVTDVNMPVMDGIEFYKRAAKENPGIKKRFLFYTGDDSPEVLSFFMANNLRYMIKPVPLDKIKETVGGIIDRRRA
ncbi:MAG: response regulator [Deltaproteobacteria bacterium]|nr:response regulator [Deltaproteobacteria bacterium]